MSNVLSEDKQQQVIALGRLGWSLRRIEREIGVRRETAGGYLRAAGIAVRPPGTWGRGAPAKPATGVTTGSEPAPPSLSVSAGSSCEPAPTDGGHIEDVNNDGLPDLVFQFPTPLTGIVCGDTSETLTGKTLSGTSIQGSDSVITVDCKKK